MVAHPRKRVVVVGNNRLFHEHRLKRRKFLRRGDGGVVVEPAVALDQYLHLRSNRLAHRADNSNGMIHLLPRQSHVRLAERIPLERLDPERHHLLRGDGEILRLARTDEPRICVHLHFVAHLAAEERMRRDVVVLSGNVPAGDFDAGERTHHHGAALPVAVAIDLEEHFLDFEGIASDDEPLVVGYASFKRHLLCSERRLAPAVESFVSLDLDERPIGAECVESVDFDVSDFHENSR